MMMSETVKYLNGRIPVRVLGSDYLVFLVERVDGKPLDDYGLRKRDWISKGAIHDEPA
jgi:hypothetical protein